MKLFSFPSFLPPIAALASAYDKEGKRLKEDEERGMGDGGRGHGSMEGGAERRVGVATVGEKGKRSCARASGS